MELEFREYDRKPFTVTAVKVTFENIQQVAEWCNGTLDKQATKMLGTEADLPVIRVKGTGDNRNKETVASLGCYIVELNGSFRVYKEPQFFASFDPRPEPEEDKQQMTLDELERVSHEN